MKANPSMKITEAAKLNGEAWRALTEEQKEPFNKLNGQDIERHEKETKQLMELGYFFNGDGVKSTLLSKKGKVMEFAQGTIMPKKAISAYMCFLKEYYATNKDTTGGTSAANSVKIISEKWNALTPDQKVKYEAL